ncbi:MULTISPECIES: hypothetical protein [Mesorhizobium]|uniref:hypothetical protein n=1 Tax=Mesorhizobium TaxID=68287 RepID=UPI0003CDD69E|nr:MULTISPECIES: hypothetical protein [Mesorhizobium]ESY63256.1 hypothetical protein X742_29870 [Mesorhizobium sp. LNHC232B00]WJI40453.1 hypothetical protein NL534_09495 [Mesorhizobium opportunistum]
MNASRLREILEKAMNLDREFKVQTLLSSVNTALKNLISSPSDSGYQQTLADTLASLGLALSTVVDSLQPAEIDRLREIGVDRFFSPEMRNEIDVWLAENPATPTVAQTKLAQLITARDEFLTQAEQTVANFTALKIEVQDIKPGEAEIGFLLPRNLFKNEFDKFIKELAVINRVIRAFSEAETGSAETIDLRQLSSSDPTIFLGLSVATIVAIGKTISWALDTWKKVEDIRKIRNETAKITSLQGSGFEAMLDDSIKKLAAKSVEERVEELLATATGDQGRKNEQRTDLTWAVESILARVERGMTVEIRMLPPVAHEGQEPSEDVKAQYRDLHTISSTLSFPAPAGSPVLDLPPPSPKEVGKATTGRSSRSGPPAAESST